MVPLVAAPDLVLVVESEAATRRLGEALGARIAPGDLVLLEGELGAGKTVLARGIARGAGARGAARSPTFMLVHRYEGGRVPIVHVDAYRLAGPADLVALGLDEVLDPAAATIVEWASRVEAALPRERLEVVLAHAGGDRREVAFRPRGARALALVGALRGRG
jgi:tRNA threonylcarbamoyladenosine biosynthesis protein TsaE